MMESKEDYLKKGKIALDDPNIKKQENFFKLDQKQICLFQLRFMLEQQADIT